MAPRGCQWIVRWISALLGISAIALPGCVTPFAAHRQELETLAASGAYEQAAATLDDPKTKDLYGAKNQVLWELDRGAVALALSQHDTAIDLLNRAEDTIEVNREKSLGDAAGQWILNDTAAAYIAEPYEDVYLNVIKILAQLEAGRIGGGATVEARRMSGKADRLRDIYLKYEDAVKRSSSAGVASSAPPSSVVAV